MKNITSKKGFTMTELVVTMTVIIILATISFISFNGYVSGSRDSKRIVDIESISTSLEIYYKKNGGIYPKPDDFVVLSVTGSDSKSKPFSYLGFVKKGMDLSFNDVPRDPITQDYYAYGITVDKKFYELSCALENYPSDPIGYSLGVDTTYAAGVDYAYIVGNYKKNIEKGYYLDHLILLEQTGGIASIPRKDIPVGTLSADEKTFTLSGGIIAVEKLEKNVPYPVYNTDEFKSVSNTPGSDDFQIIVDNPDITIGCGDNCGE